jgi:hypothetical protein
MTNLCAGMPERSTDEVFDVLAQRATVRSKPPHLREV